MSTRSSNITALEILNSIFSERSSAARITIDTTIHVPGMESGPPRGSAWVADSAPIIAGIPKPTRYREVVLTSCLGGCVCWCVPPGVCLTCLFERAYKHNWKTW